MKKFGLILVALLLSVTPVAAQQECVNTSGPFQVNSGAPYTITWLMDAQVPVSSTDPTLVPQRIDGFFLQIDGGPKVDLGPLVSTGVCGAGSNVGKLIYTFRTSSGVPRGSHNAAISGWNFVLDSNGAPTTTKQEGIALVIPFDAVDPIRLGPPTAPLNGQVKK